MFIILPVYYYYYDQTLLIHNLLNKTSQQLTFQSTTRATIHIHMFYISNNTLPIIIIIIITK